jgi:hypothetical protein
VPALAALGDAHAASYDLLVGTRTIRTNCCARAACSPL